MRELLDYLVAAIKDLSVSNEPIHRWFVSLQVVGVLWEYESATSLVARYILSEPETHKKYGYVVGGAEEFIKRHLTDALYIELIQCRWRTPDTYGVSWLNNRDLFIHPWRKRR